MVRKQVPRPLWDYGMVCVSEVMSLTFTTAGGLNGCVPHTHVTGETSDISEYLDFGFYDQIWYKDNAGLGPLRPGRWLGISRGTGRLMTYHVLTETGSVLTRSSVQRVTELEKQIPEYKELSIRLDCQIHKRLNTKDRRYIGSKPKSED